MDIVKIPHVRTRDNPRCYRSNIASENALCFAELNGVKDAAGAGNSFSLSALKYLFFRFCEQKRNFRDIFSGFI